MEERKTKKQIIEGEGAADAEFDSGTPDFRSESDRNSFSMMIQLMPNYPGPK
ncbi:MAG TPA: hypothetical protein VFF30_00835 [Nitrososphaerales archaeon]|nr:hypothetical protein [Nitrososphaerales archaeon]